MLIVVNLDLIRWVVLKLILLELMYIFYRFINNINGGLIMDKNKIKCDVSNCKYEKEGDCTLKNVIISCSGSGRDCCDTSSTLCQSFVSSGGIITDNEYEVISEFEFN